LEEPVKVRGLSLASVALLATLHREIGETRTRGVRLLVRARALPAFRENATSPALPAHHDTFEDVPPSPGTLPSLRMVSDAREVLLAAFDPEEARTREAFWTRSSFLARSMHDALAAELCGARIEAMTAEGLSVDEVEAVIEEWREARRMV
jgi:hypothetical protein